MASNCIICRGIISNNDYPYCDRCRYKFNEEEKKEIEERHSKELDLQMEILKNENR
jgi:hypothetical protein